MSHPAHMMSFETLITGLEAAKAQRLVSESRDADGLSLFCYTKGCVYERAWTPITTVARGLIVDRRAERIVATPFAKFFNLGEMQQDVPPCAFETFEKMDGSMIILFHHAGQWRTATKGSFGSAQAAWAAEWIKRLHLDRLDPDVTYLCEAIYPENRIVVRYERAALVLLAAFDNAGEGRELAYDDLYRHAVDAGLQCVGRRGFNSLADLVAAVGQMSGDEEGFVIRFETGLRLKVKGEEYRRLHALISRCTPLAMWEAMAAGDDMALVRRELPEEFWGDFDGITQALERHMVTLQHRVAIAAGTVAHLSDKDVGLMLDVIQDPVRRFIFPYRKNGDLLAHPKSRQALFREIRPKANQLPGYVPSYALHRVFEESL